MNDQQEGVSSSGIETGTRPSNSSGTTGVPVQQLVEAVADMEVDLAGDENEAGNPLVGTADEILRDVDLALGSAPNSPEPSPPIQLDEGRFYFLLFC